MKKNTGTISNLEELFFSFFPLSFQTGHIYIVIHPGSKAFLTEFPLSDFSLTAKNLVARLMEVDQDQRLTAQEAINHEW